jgi:hypothetical protein
VENSGLSVMWQNAGAVRWLYVCMSHFMYQIDSGWVEFVGVWGGYASVAYCVERRWGPERRWLSRCPSGI